MTTKILTGNDVREAREALGLTRPQVAAALEKSVDWMADTETRARRAQHVYAMVIASLPAIRKKLADEFEFVLAATMVELQAETGATRLQMAQTAGFTSAVWTQMALAEDGRVSRSTYNRMRAGLLTLQAAGLTGRKGDRRADRMVRIDSTSLLRIRQRYNVAARECDEIANLTKGRWGKAEKGNWFVDRDAVNLVLTTLKTRNAEKVQNTTNAGGIYWVNFKTSDGRNLVKFGCAEDDYNLRHRQSLSNSTAKARYEDRLGFNLTRIASCGYALPGSDHLVIEAVMLDFARDITGGGIVLHECSRYAEYFIDASGDLVEQVFANLRATGLLIGAIPVNAPKFKVGVAIEHALLAA